MDSFQQLVVLGLFALGAAMVIYFVRLAERARYEKLLGDVVREARKDSLDQSRSTLKGQIAEQMAPMLPGFSYSPADARFLGDPVDYVVFNGRSAFGGTEETEMEIVLVEIKKGQSRLSQVQRAIGRAVEQGRVRFEVCQIAEDGSVTTTTWQSDRRGSKGAALSAAR